MPTILNRVRTYLGYDAANGSHRRTAPPARLRSEDAEQTKKVRKDITNAARDIRRNFAIAAWAIRKHLDFVSSFTFTAKTDDEGLNRELEAYVAEWSRPGNCDARRMHPLRRIVRLAEAHRTVDGDVALLKIRSGHLQAIEGDRIRDPEGENASQAVQAQEDNGRKIIHGVATDGKGRPLSYAVHGRRDGGAFTFERWVRRSNLFVHGYYDRFDQVRGISPLTAALNTYRDVYETFDYAVAKAKIAQLFGLVLYRDALDAPEPGAEADDSTAADSGYSIDFGKGPFMLDLDPGDRAEFLENKTGGEETVTVSAAMIGAALKALDIPFSFYDESFTNFFGSRAALILYQKSAKYKQDDNRDLLTDATRWRLNLAIASGELALPGRMTAGDLALDWIPSGVPWWNPAQEVTADVNAVDAGLRSRTEIRRERFGDDWRDVIDKLAAEQEYAESKGVLLGPAGFDDPTPPDANA